MGACVGMKGNRVQAIIRELRGEKIDIIEWSEDPIVFITNAISPARAQRVTVTNDAEKEIEVVVEERQLSLAIGKKGQNVRLAAKLTGWKIDIKDEEEKRKEVEAQLDGLSTDDSVTLTLPGLDDDQIRNLANAGFDTADRLLEASSEQLSEVAGIDKETAEQLHITVREQVEAAQKASLASLEENNDVTKEEDSERSDAPN